MFSNFYFKSQIHTKFSWTETDVVKTLTWNDYSVIISYQNALIIAVALDQRLCVVMTDQISIFEGK